MERAVTSSKVKHIMNKHLLKPILLATLTTALLLGGCGTDRSPVAAGNQPTIVQTEDGRTLLAFSPAALQRAAKIATTGNPHKADTPRTVSGLIKVNPGGAIVVQEDMDNGGPHNDFRIALEVGRNQVAENVVITMTVYGSTLEDLVVGFDPGGFAFVKPAKLSITVGKERYTAIPEGVTVQHEYSDGTVEAITVTHLLVQKDGGRINIKLDVPGFSRYSMGGGE